jgi:hypothetical protein
MYQSFEVRNFRCFRELKLDELAQINLVVGANNVGKTALLEALFIHCGTYRPELTFKVNAFRGVEQVKVELGRWAETPWDGLFHQFDVSQAIALEGKDTVAGWRLVRLRVLRDVSELAEVMASLHTVGVTPVPYGHLRVSVATEIAQVLELEYTMYGRGGKFYAVIDPNGVRFTPIPPAPPFPAFFQTSRGRVSFRDEAEMFGNLQVRGEQDEVLKVLRLIEPRLRRLEMVVVAGEPILHGDIGGNRMIPLPFLGEGMVRLASLVLHIGNAPDGVVLVDEIENGLHHTVLTSVWQAVGEAARKFNTQIFATTHSLECVIAAHKVFSQTQSCEFLLHRLERVNDEIRAITYDRETLKAAIEADLEVR